MNRLLLERRIESYEFHLKIEVTAPRLLWFHGSYLGRRVVNQSILGSRRAHLANIAGTIEFYVDGEDAGGGAPALRNSSLDPVTRQRDLSQALLTLVGRATAIWHRFFDNLAGNGYYVRDMTRVLRRKRVVARTKPIRQASGSSPLGASLGLRETDIDALINEIRAGLPFKTLESFSLESGISVSEIATLIELPERTLARRKVAGRLDSGESERLLRLSKVFEQAVSLFEGNVQAAVAWLKTPKRALGGKSPWTYLQTEIGAREVEDLIGQLEHGVFA